MSHVDPSFDFAPPSDSMSHAMVADPRIRMFLIFPAMLQPFFTWLTARPAPGEEMPRCTPLSFVRAALGWIALGVAITAAASCLPVAAAVPLVVLGLLFTCCGLGLFQVVIFHHCSHNTVFTTRERNRLAGRLISSILLFKHFDAYQHEHMLHHSAKKLLTEEDEFADFIFGMCGLEAAMPKRLLWRRVLCNLVSPRFHARFLLRRLNASLRSPDRTHNAIGISFWTGGFALASFSGTLSLFLLAWVLPVTVLLQIATVFRILCEHRFPEPEVIAARGKSFVCDATTGVFPGAMPPSFGARGLVGLAAWTAWWTQMLTWQLFVRLFVLVGDAPCHDFHHRRPATKRWTSYIHARQQDCDAGSPGWPCNYNDVWGLLRAVDQNLATLAATPTNVVYERMTAAAVNEHSGRP